MMLCLSCVVLKIKTGKRNVTQRLCLFGCLVLSERTLTLNRSLTNILKENRIRNFINSFTSMLIK